MKQCKKCLNNREYRLYRKKSSSKDGFQSICKKCLNNPRPLLYTKDKCIELSLLYTTRNEFCKSQGSAYNVSRKNGWLDEICSHMKSVGNLHKRCIYSYIFPDNFVYIGLTFNLEKRHESHTTNYKSSVFQHIEKTKLTPILKQETNYLDIELASIKETEIANFYKGKGFSLLNKIKTGGLGHLPKWDLDNCYIAALECDSRSEFSIKYSQAYSILNNLNLLNDACAHMISIKKPKGYWNNKGVCYNVSLFL